MTFADALRTRGLALGLPVATMVALAGAWVSAGHPEAVFWLLAGLVLAAANGLRELVGRYGAEETLRRREERFRALVEDSADGIALFDAEGRIVWTGANTAILGYEDAEVAGRPIADLVHPEDLERLQAFFGEVPSEASRVVTAQFRLRHKDGSWRWLEGSLRNLLQSPAVKGVVANYRDVTLQRRLQDDLSRAAAEWRLTFDAIASPVLVVRPPATLVRLNQAGQALAGRSFDALVGHDLGELGAGEPWRSAALLALQVGATQKPRTLEASDPQAGKTWEVAATVLSREAAMEPLVIVVAREVTERVELQASLRRSETLSAMGSLVAGVAHEVRNPLFSIGANLDALAAELGEDGSAAPHFDVLRAEMTRLNTLMQDLLEYGKPGRPRFEPMPLADVVRVAVGSLRAQAENAGIGLENRVPADLIVATDRGRLARVFQNLVENALQHAPAASTVTVRADTAGPERVVCVVEDAGPGFPDADLPRVFEPFFTRRRGGTGLGLSIVARIAEEHGGRVTADNRPEGGARVRVELPRVKRPPQATWPAPGAKVLSPGAAVRWSE